MQTKQRLDVPLSLKSVSDSGEFEGYGSVFGVKDSHDDVVMSGAFAASLRAWSDRKALPALLWQHRMDEPIGVYTEMKEDDVGLYVRGRLLIDDDPLAKRAHAHMKAGSLTGLSIGYVLKDWEYDRSKEAFLLICAEDTDNHSYDGVLRSYELITDYCKWHDRGKLTVTGVSGKGEILNTDALQKAEKMGQSV